MTADTRPQMKLARHLRACANDGRKKTACLSGAVFRLANEGVFSTCRDCRAVAAEGQSVESLSSPPFSRTKEMALLSKPRSIVRPHHPILHSTAQNPCRPLA